MKIFIFWASYIWFPFALFCLYALLRCSGLRRWLAALALTLSLPLAWARFVEPQILITPTTQIDLSQGAGETRTLRVALFSDPHIGIFSNTIALRRIVNRINNSDVSAVFVAGDWLYEGPAEDIPEQVAALGDLNAPVFAVMGNHDVGFPGPFYGDALYSELRRLGVTLVENRAVETEIDGLPLIVSGASDLWQGRQSFRFASNLPEDRAVLMLVHNPDTALYVPNDFEYDLMLAGHTHGGQINLLLPAIMKHVMPTRYPFNEGLHTMPDGRSVFVTAGTGQVGLPMRFLRPPRIDILELRLPVNAVD